jgi:hypothetical protein
LGESAVLLPDMIAAALAVNDCAELRLTLMQEALAKAAGLDNSAFGSTVAGARSAGEGRIEIPAA